MVATERGEGIFDESPVGLTNRGAALVTGQLVPFDRTWPRHVDLDLTIESIDVDGGHIGDVDALVIPFAPVERRELVVVDIEDNAVARFVLGCGNAERDDEAADDIATIVNPVSAQHF